MPGEPSSVAFVLSGAGTKGAFEVGVLDHLIADAGITPGIITATSAGSILAAVLAQARTTDEFTTRVGELRADLLAMTRTDLVFGRQPWLAEMQGTAFGDAVEAFITDRSRPPVPPDPDAPEPGGSDSRRPVAAGDGAVGPPSRHHHRWHNLTRLVEMLPAARRAKDRLPGHASSLLTLDPLGDALRRGSDTGIVPIDPALISRPGLQLRLTVTALRDGVHRYVTGDGALVEADARTVHLDAGSVPIVDGVLASCSVPMVFPPRDLGDGDERYVDGGVLRNIPVDAAVALGARRVYAVCGVPLGPQVDPNDYRDANLLAVHLRTGVIAFSDQQRRDLETGRGAGTSLTVIAPTVDVVGPLEVAQGLMLIDMDYGRLRAEEVLADIGEPERAEATAASDAITGARERAWYAEEALWSASAAAGTAAAALAEVRHAKDQVARSVQRRADIGFPVPMGAESWWLEWETHARPRPAFLPASPAG